MHGPFIRQLMQSLWAWMTTMTSSSSQWTWAPSRLNDSGNTDYLEKNNMEFCKCLYYWLIFSGKNGSTRICKCNGICSRCPTDVLQLLQIQSTITWGGVYGEKTAGTPLSLLVNCIQSIVQGSVSESGLCKLCWTWTQENYISHFKKQDNFTPRKGIQLKPISETTMTQTQSCYHSRWLCKLNLVKSRFSSTYFKFLFPPLFNTEISLTSSER